MVSTERPPASSPPAIATGVYKSTMNHFMGHLEVQTGVRQRHVAMSALLVPCSFCYIMNRHFKTARTYMSKTRAENISKTKTLFFLFDVFALVGSWFACATANESSRAIPRRLLSRVSCFPSWGFMFSLSLWVSCFPFRGFMFSQT